MTYAQIAAILIASYLFVIGLFIFIIFLLYRLNHLSNNLESDINKLHSIILAYTINCAVTNEQYKYYLEQMKVLNNDKFKGAKEKG